MSGVGSSPALATYETSQVLLAGVSGGFPGVLPFRPTYRLARLYSGLGAKIVKNRSAAPPRKNNSIATMHQVYIYGAWKTMFY